MDEALEESAQSQHLLNNETKNQIIRKTLICYGIEIVTLKYLR